MKLLALLYVMLVLFTASAEPPPEVLALGGVDPVELSRGRESPGLPEHIMVRGRYRYQFTSAANREVFAKEPTRYQIQFGGG